MLLMPQVFEQSLFLLPAARPSGYRTVRVVVADGGGGLFAICEVARSRFSICASHLP